MRPSSGSLCLEAVRLSREYRLGGETIHVLAGASLKVERGEFIAIMGASGSGKSTFLHILGGLDAPNAGVVRYDGTDLYACAAAERAHIRNNCIGFVFQFYHLLPELTVYENVLLPRMIQHSGLQWLKVRRSCHRAAMDVLEQVGMADRARHRPRELSGGERQRTAIARALVNGPDLLLADEPTGNLDEATGREILDVLTSLNRAGQAFVLVTHDPAVSQLAHRRLDLKFGKLS